MIRGLHIAATGMVAQQHNIDVISNNIANVNTSGYKKSRAEFQDLIYDTLNYTSGATSGTTANPTGIDVGLGVRLSNVQRSFLQGDISQTGNDLDVAIEGKGFFKITLPNGEMAYTRNGSFKLDSEGSMVNSQGYKLDPEIVIPNTLTDISVAADGTVSGLDPTTGETAILGQITLVDFVNPAGLSPYGDSLFLSTDVSGDPIEGTASLDAFGILRQGMIESSNVQLVTEMVALISAQRAYEANSKSISSTDEMLSIVNRLKQ
jgi:flagellar basal-body rod protein FlgG